MISNDVERERLELVASDSWYERGSHAATIVYCAEVWSRFWRGGRGLELGPAEGLMTARLQHHFEELTLVDGSERFCSRLREQYPGATVVNELFEAYEPEHRFDVVILGHVLEHVADPGLAVQRAATWLNPGGRVFAAVPNARSVHRQAAVLMGLLGEEHELNDTDRHHGHRRVFDPESFRALFLGADLKIVQFGGYWLKPVSNAQIDQTWTPEMLRAFLQLGERYPDIAAEMYVVAEAGGPDGQGL